MTLKIQISETTSKKEPCCDVDCCGVSILRFPCSQRVLYDVTILTMLISSSIFSVCYIGGSTPDCLPSVQQFCGIQSLMFILVTIFFMANYMLNRFFKLNNCLLNFCRKCCFFRKCCFSRAKLMALMSLFCLSYFLALYAISFSCLDTLSRTSKTVEGSKLFIMGFIWGMVCCIAMSAIIIKQFLTPKNYEKNYNIKLLEEDK